MTTPPAGQPVHLIWRRDTSKEPRGWLKWAVGVVVALCGFGAFAAYMADDPGQITTFAGLGMILIFLLWLIPVVYDVVKRRNPEIRSIGRELAWAKKRVPIDFVDRFSVRENVTSVYNGTTEAEMRVTVCEFRMLDGSKEAFTFANLPATERAELAAAIDRVLPGRRVASF